MPLYFSRLAFRDLQVRRREQILNGSLAPVFIRSTFGVLLMTRSIINIAPDESTKREAYITIGRHTHRIACDHHKLLSEVKEAFPYCTMEEIFFMTSHIGASLFPIINFANVINVLRRDR
jgi:hypothetical protein